MWRALLTASLLLVPSACARRSLDVGVARQSPPEGRGTDRPRGDADVTEALPNDAGVAMSQPDASTSSPSSERLLWVEALRSNNASGRAIATFDDGSLVITGSFFEDLTLDPDGSREVTFARPSGSLARAFVAKYDPERRLEWVREVESSGSSQGYSVAVSRDGSVALAGVFAGGDVVLGRGEPGETRLSAVRGNDAFLAKYAPDGTLRWAASAASEDHELFNEVVALPDGSIVVVGEDTPVGGETDTTTVFAPESPTPVRIAMRGGFLARFAADGELAWAQSTGGRTAWHVQVTPDEGILVLGYIFETDTIGPGQATAQALVSRGARDIYLARYSVTGALEWVRQYGAETNDQPTNFALAPDGAIWMNTSSSTVPPRESDPRDYFSSLVRLAPDGDVQFELVAAGSLPFRGELAALSDGSCVIASRLEASLTLDVAGRGPVEFAPNGEANILLRHYLPDGELVWAERAGGPGRDRDAVDGIATFADDTVVIVGTLFTGEAVFGRDQPSEVRVEVPGLRLPFFAAYGR